MSSIIASPLLLYFLLAVALQNIVALPQCFPENKTVTMSEKESFHIYCTLQTVSTGDRFVWIRDKVILGACSVKICKRKFDRYDIIVSNKNPKVLSLYVRDLTSKDNGEYSLSIQSPNSEIKNIPIMNLTVVLRSLEPPECATTVKKDESSIELSCKLTNPVRHGHISVSILAGNKSLANAHFYRRHQTSVTLETINELKYKIDYINLLMETLPSGCFVTNTVEAKACTFAQIIELESINKDEYLNCSTQNSVEVKSDVWLIKMFNRTIKLLTMPQNIVGEEILHGNNIVLAICGTETDKAIDVYKVLKVVMNDYDTCYTAYVDKSLTETTFRISGCASTTVIAGATSDMSEYGDGGINATTLTTQYTDYLSSTSTKPIDMDMKSTFGPANVSKDKKYEIIFYMISALAFLCSIVTCLNMVRRHTNKSTKKHLRSQYHSRNHRLTLGSEIADNTETAATDLIALHPLDPSNEAQSSLIRSHDQDRGEVSRSWLSSQSQETHPALPPRDTCRYSNQKTSAEFHFYSTENENGKFPSLEPPEIDNKNKDSEGGKAKVDALNGPENIYNTVSDEMDEKLGACANISLISDSASICLDYKEALHGSKPGNDFAVTGGNQPEVNSNNLRTESDFNSSMEVCVEKLYAKPNKKTKSISFSTSVVEESCAVSPSPGDSSDYEELRN